MVLARSISMSLFLDSKYIDNVSHLFRNFKRKADQTWNFSCPICGDSKKNKLKARGYIIRSKSKDGSPQDGLSYKCHNCSVSLPFGEFLKMIDADTHKQYVLEKFKESGDKTAKKKPAPKKVKGDYAPAKPTVLVGCPSIQTLGPDHPARKYIEARKIPASFFKEIFWTDDFGALAEKVSPGQKLKKEGRIVIPFMDRKYQLLAIQGRSLDPNAAVRYITIKAFEDAPKIYGIHRLGATWKRIYIVEGPFDSMFLPNSLAMAGSDIPHALPRDKVVVVYDNEPVKEDTREKVEKAIDKGYRVCLWPNTIQEKDINDMILSGYTPEWVRTTIDQNSFSGLEAKAKFGMWGKRTPGEYPGQSNRKENGL